tara:strand:+ start:17238 stop:18110 length:873 start_codon:yes stop_codon:yes gene_type:complete
MQFFKSQENIGIVFALFAYLTFSIVDVFQKYASINQSIFQLLLFRYFFLLLFSIIESKRKSNNIFWKSKNIKNQLLRSVLSITESAFFILSFRHLQLADAHSVASLTPVIIVILSVLVLKEKVSSKTWIAVFIGFIGVLIILRPGLSVFEPKSLLPLLAAFFLGLYQIVTRKVSRYDSNETSLFFTSVTGIFITSLLLIYFWTDLNINTLMLLIGIAILSSLGMYFHIIALSKARASIIQPFHYTLVFWSIIFGFIFYDHFPDVFTVLGALLIGFAGIYIAKQQLISEKK